MSKHSIFHSNTTKLRVGVIAGAVLMSSLVASVAGAAYGGSSIGNGIAPGSVVQGQTLLIEGSGFKVGDTLTIIANTPSHVLGHTRTNNTGSFKSNLKIPKTWAPGRYLIEFRGAAVNGTLHIDKLTIVVHQK